MWERQISHFFGVVKIQWHTGTNICGKISFETEHFCTTNRFFSLLCKAQEKHSEATLFINPLKLSGYYTYHQA